MSKNSTYRVTTKKTQVKIQPFPEEKNPET